MAGSLIEAVAELGIPDLPAPLELVGDYVIVGDVHVPYTDWSLALRVAQVGQAQRIDRLIVAGDFWNYDAYSFYPATTLLPSWKTEKRAGIAVVKEWAQTFKEIYFIMGNHERRKQKLTAGEEDDEDIFSPLAAVAKIKSSALGWCTVQSGGVPWLIAHPKEYSVNQLVVVDGVAQKELINTIGFHEHHLAIGRDKFKHFTIVNGGCLVDPGKLAYVVMDKNKKPGMARGFVSLRNGYVTLYGNGITDWEDYGLTRSARRQRAK